MQNSINALQFILGILSIWGTLGLLWYLKRKFFINVEDETDALLFKFGSLVKIVNRPGLQFCPHLFPWVKVVNVSRQIDFKIFENIPSHDLNGTSFNINLWMEYNITNSKDALFSVDDWESSLKSLVISLMTGEIGQTEFMNVHNEREKLCQKVLEKINEISSTWGIKVHKLILSNIELTPTIELQLFHSIAAKLEKEKAKIEEEGRLKVAQLEASTNKKIAELTAHAKSQYPKAIGRALFEIAKDKDVLGAYKELYELSRTKPQRVIAFKGFDSANLDATDASLIARSIPRGEKATKEHH